jgi:hypothetical protein
VCFNLGVVEVVGSNPAGPISENPAFPKGFAGFFRFSVESSAPSKVSEFAPREKSHYNNVDICYG